MRRIKTILPVAIIFFFATVMSAQLQFGLSTGASYGQLSEEDEISFFNSDLASSVALNVKFNTNKNFYFSGALNLESIGWIIYDIESVYFSLDEYVKGIGLSLSADFGYNVYSSEKFDLGFSAGYKIGSIRNREYIQEFDFEEKFNADIDILGGISGYKGLEFKSNLILHLTETFDLSITPSYTIFHRRLYREQNYAERNIGMQIGILYTLTTKE